MKGMTCACNCPIVLAGLTLQILDLWFFESFCFVSLFFAFSEVDYLEKILLFKKKYQRDIRYIESRDIINNYKQ